MMKSITVGYNRQCNIVVLNCRAFAFVNICTGLASVVFSGEPSPKFHEKLAMPVISFVKVTVSGVHIVIRS